jgi:membrane protein YqaA with SNARE-associated domain
MTIKIMKNILEIILTNIRNLASTKYGIWILFIISFVDSSLIPLPSTTIFMMFSFIDDRKVYKYVLFITLGSLAGAVTGYYIGHWAWVNSSGEFTEFAKTIFNNIPGFSEKFYNEVRILYAKWDYRILLLAVCTPIPYGLFSISSGIFDIHILVFILATTIGHLIKYIVISIITLKSGKELKRLPLRKLTRIAVITTICIVIVIFVS